MTLSKNSLLDAIDEAILHSAGTLATDIAAAEALDLASAINQLAEAKAWLVDRSHAKS